MKAIYYCQGADERLLSVLRRKLPTHEIYDWQSDPDIPLSSIDAAITWLPPDDFFDSLPNLKTVYALAAGVDHLLNHPGLPRNVQIVRLCDAGMGAQMAEYVLYGVLHAHRKFHELKLAQQQSSWFHEIDVASAVNTCVGILGAGTLGQVVANRLSLNGYKVNCWSRNPRDLPDGITSFHGQDTLSVFLSQANILVCLLPLTPATSGILNQSLFNQLPHNAFVINPGRGQHLVVDDLLAAIDSNQLSGAMLDVFDKEPLPADHPLWRHPRVIVTPHIAAKSLVEESASQVSSSVQIMERGGIPEGLVDRGRGY